MARLNVMAVLDFTEAKHTQIVGLPRHLHVQSILQQLRGCGDILWKSNIDLQQLYSQPWHQLDLKNLLQDSKGFEHLLFILATTLTEEISFCTLGTIYHMNLFNTGTFKQIQCASNFICQTVTELTNVPYPATVASSSFNESDSSPLSLCHLSVFDLSKYLSSFPKQDSWPHASWPLFWFSGISKLVNWPALRVSVALAAMLELPCSDQIASLSSACLSCLTFTKLTTFNMVRHSFFHDSLNVPRGFWLHFVNNSSQVHSSKSRMQGTN